jgi:NAD-dependent DNA ligase
MRAYPAGALAVHHAALKHIVYCPVCKTVINVEPNRAVITCTNPLCGQSIMIETPTHTRGRDLSR